MSRVTALSWSGGKDSSLALYFLMKSGDYDVKYLLTTITRDFDRISMHGVRRELLELQSASLGIPRTEVSISYRAGNEEYESKMKDALSKFLAMGINNVAFGDIFLEDIRRYREQRLSQPGLSFLFPLWGEDTSKLAKKFIQLGFRAVVCTVDPRFLSRDFAGREYDEAFLDALPASVDPCGERGEFHTFVYDGPIFNRPLDIRVGEIVLRDSFYFADILSQ